MTPLHSPRPWTIDEIGNIVDANGERVIADDGALYPEDRDYIVLSATAYEKMSKALEEIAKQKLCDEMNPNDDIEQYGDFEGAYDMMIETARAALASSDDGWVKVDEEHPLPSDLHKNDEILVVRSVYEQWSDGKISGWADDIHDAQDIRAYRRRPSAEQGE